MNKKYIRKWHIIEMEHVDKEYIDLVVPGYVTFDKDGFGEFQFGTVHAFLKFRIEKYSEIERIEFSWGGKSEIGPVRGRGWAMIKENKLHGRLYLHGGYDSWFIAEMK